jgi:GntR family transcriptional regulator
MVENGFTVRTEVLEFREAESDERTAAVFGIPAGSEVVKLRRLRIVDGSPDNFCTNYLPVSLFPGFLSKDLVNRSLYDVMEEDYGYQVNSFQGTVEARIAGAYEAKLLGMPMGMPVQYVENVSYLIDGSPIELYMVTYRGDTNKLSYQIRKK